MSFLKYILLLLILCSTLISIKAQESHFTQNIATPLYVNPALTGLYNGDFRVAADYRSQWGSLKNSSGARTIMLSADAKLIKGISKGGWLSGGLLFYNDKLGTVSFSTNVINASVAYNSSMGDGHSFISFGAMFGISTRSLDLNNAQFGNQYDGVGYSSEVPSNEIIATDGFTNLNIAGGAVYYYLKDSRNYAFGGGAAYNIGSAVYSFQNNEDATLPMRLSLQAGGSFSLSRSLDIVPSIYFMNHSEAMKIDLGSLVRFVYSSNFRTGEFRAFNVGPYLRINKNANKAMGVDALMLVAKVDYDAVSIGFSYDFNLSKLNNATNGKGGPELSVIYSPKVRPAQKSAVSCPRF